MTMGEPLSSYLILEQILEKVILWDLTLSESTITLGFPSTAAYLFIGLPFCLVALHFYRLRVAYLAPFCTVSPTVGLLFCAFF